MAIEARTLDTPAHDPDSAQLAKLGYTSEFKGCW